MKKHVLVSIIVVLLSAVLCGCNSTASQLKGQWFEEHGYLQLNIDQDCEVAYYLSGMIEVKKNFAYQLTDDALVLLNEDGVETPITLVFSEQNNTLEALEYHSDDEKIVFVRKETEPASVRDDLIAAMNESALQSNALVEEGKNAEAAAALLGFADESILYDTVNAFMDSLNDLQDE
jgi:hypothetical protein